MAMFSVYMIFENIVVRSGIMKSPNTRFRVHDPEGPAVLAVDLCYNVERRWTGATRLSYLLLEPR